MSNSNSRKHRVLSHHAASDTESIAEAVVIKDHSLFCVTSADGQIPLHGRHGLGLYYHDCRYLNGYAVRLNGREPNALAATSAKGFQAIFELVGPEMSGEPNAPAHREDLGISLVRTVDSEDLGMCDTFTFENFSLKKIELTLSLSFRAEFEDVFAVRGVLPEQQGRREPPRWDSGVLRFTYDGADGYQRQTALSFSPDAEQLGEADACFTLSLNGRQKQQVCVTAAIAETRGRASAGPEQIRMSDRDKVERRVSRSAARWLHRFVEITSDSVLLNEVIRRSFRDLRVLETKLEGREFFSAGVPWFVTLYGRDSIITALQTITYDRSIAEQTLRVLAALQGTRVDPWKDEQPGRILHELRVGEMARTGEIPHTPYYGTIDATPLFLILLGQHAAWTGTLALFDELNGCVEAALDWMDRYGKLEDASYLAYSSETESGLANQGWKDSGNAIVNADGTLATPPIALVEAQAYAYRARLAMAELFERSGKAERAAMLRRGAEDLYNRFNRDFWMPSRNFYALALQKGDRKAAVISSNPGHALWAGIVPPDRAGHLVKRLISTEMFNGWGIRTLSSKERGYNPLGYHLGTVWPHDTSLIADGFKRYGFDAEAHMVASSLIQAAMHFPNYRLPELFAGISRASHRSPVRYPVACHPQAWAAGSVPFLLQTFLGLTPEAFERRLRIVRPSLPEFVARLEVYALQVGEAKVDLRFERTPRGVTAVQVMKIEGRLDVIVEPGEAGERSN